MAVRVVPTQFHRQRFTDPRQYKKQIHVKRKQTIIKSRLRTTIRNQSSTITLDLTPLQSRTRRRTSRNQNWTHSGLIRCQLGSTRSRWRRLQQWGTKQWSTPGRSSPSNQASTSMRIWEWLVFTLPIAIISRRAMVTKNTPNQHSKTLMSSQTNAMARSKWIKSCIRNINWSWVRPNPLARTTTTAQVKITIARSQTARGCHLSKATQTNSLERVQRQRSSMKIHHPNTILCFRLKSLWSPAS